MNYEPKDLADIVKDYLEDNGKSEIDIANNSGGEISQGYINDIKNRKVLGENITIKKLKALARGMAIPETLIFDIALGITKQRSLPEDFTAIFLELDKNRQSDLFEIAKVFYYQKLNPNLLQ